MSEKSIKADAATDRTVSELAFFLRTTKKHVVAIAVADYVEQRDRYLDPAAAHAGTGTLLDLAPLERLALRRKELARAFAKHEAGDIRLLDPEFVTPGSADIVLLAETDLLEGGRAAYDLSRVASMLLGAHVEVISTTMLELFDRPGLRGALDQSRPL
ncbi:hypothetical protein [Agromyces marinus]|uniref:Uncharacterized protein n=1 Tax=Agromyces marinus TaxID=1389020 RepID=A0ABM8H3B5_9MICO|nr:hypothetical protein [Agromyces marinus]UIP59652.1 hypothetical protein DSM26151_25660 [Agromyces marinus]BDZ55279.1 hypothetical protein GCM10025870_23520 [Agromyces marinus]